MGGSASAPVVEILTYKGKVYLVDSKGLNLEIRESESASNLQLPPHLDGKRIIILDSIKSGTGRSSKADIYHKVLEPLCSDIGLKHEYWKTESASSAEEWASNLTPQGSLDLTLVIFLSGDTTINEFINALGTNSSGGELVVFPIPAGTGNSLLLSLGIDDGVGALQRLFSVSAEKKPLFTYEAHFPPGSYLSVQEKKVRDITKPMRFLVVLSWAFHAAIVADSDTPTLRNFGVARFKMAAVKNLASPRTYTGTTSVNGTPVDIDTYGYWLVTPARRFEKTFDILPDGDLLKNELYLVAFSKAQDIMTVMNQVYDKGAHALNENVIYRRLTPDDKLVLELGVAESRFCVDGSIIRIPDSQSEVSVLFPGNKVNGWDLMVLS